jgi:hypothetical protein
VANGKTLPQDVIDLWPEIFEDVELNVVPLNYVHLIEITFKNDKVWEIDFKKNLKVQSWEAFEQELKTIIKNYEEEIRSIDFKLDTDKIKRDISRSTKRFLRNKRLK